MMGISEKILIWRNISFLLIVVSALIIESESASLETGTIKGLKDVSGPKKWRDSDNLVASEKESLALTPVEKHRQKHSATVAREARCFFDWLLESSGQSHSSWSQPQGSDDSFLPDPRLGQPIGFQIVQREGDHLITSPFTYLQQSDNK